jgi:hypothetical protein
MLFCRACILLQEEGATGAVLRFAPIGNYRSYSLIDESL